MNGTDQTGIAMGTGAGAHGVTAGGPGALVAESVGNVWRWFNTPFTTPLDPMSLALMVGVVVVALIGWQLILYHVRIAAETLV